MLMVFFAIAVASGVVAGRPLHGIRRAANDTRPNFVFYFPDETRAESLGVYGHPIAKTPNYDRFAKEGTLFTSAHVLHTQCSPSRCALITGRYMHVLGHRTQTHLVRSYEDNFFRRLKDEGYHILWLGKNDMLSADSMPLSVSEWYNEIGVSNGGNAYAFNTSGYYSFMDHPSGVAPNSTKNGDYSAVIHALNFMQNSPPEPFLIWIPGMGAHPPYGAPKEYHEMYDPQQIKQKSPLRPVGLPNKPDYYSTVDGIPHWRNLNPLNEDFFYKLNSVYLGRVTYSDWIFGELLNGIDSLALADRTTVLVSSDHGDFAGDAHLVEKWPGGLDDMLTRVPLIVRTPGGTPTQRIDSPVNTFDAFATILDLANVTINHVQFATSFKERLFNRIGHPYPNNTVYSEGGFFYSNEMEPNDPSQHSIVENPKGMYYPRFKEEMQHYPDGSPRAVMLRNATHKLVYRPRGQSELYDLHADPRELNNLMDDGVHSGLQTDLMRQLLRWYVQTGDVTPMNDDPRGPPKYPLCTPADNHVLTMYPVDTPDEKMVVRWQMLAESSQLQLLGSSLCLTGVSNANTAAPSLALADCAQKSGEQRFAFNVVSGQFQCGKLCLDAGDASPSVGTTPLLYECHDFPWKTQDQQWLLVRDKDATSMRIVSQANDKVSLGACVQ